ncbi:D-alanyl-D-alanine carboxypeptidase [Candidatus Falkowbacteria bacterium]|nr:D-alanyl-D-alanine carboxypeptidase [Candidatus Falkowbacteria bacterium]
MIFELFIALIAQPLMNSFVHESLLIDSQREVETQSITPRQSDIIDVPLSAQSAILIDESSGVILYEKDAHTKRSIASITKLMTVLVFLDQKIDMNKEIVMQKEDRHQGGIEHFLVGESIRVADLVYATLVGSDNEGAYLLMRASGMSKQDFVTAMNQKAQSLGMQATEFTEPSGLDAGNVSTAHDLVLLLRAARSQPLIADATTRSSYSFEVKYQEEVRDVKVVATNYLTSSSYLEIITAKTGYLPQAGYCLAALLTGQHKRNISAIVLGATTIESRFADIKALEFISSQLYEYHN